MVHYSNLPYRRAYLEQEPHKNVGQEQGGSSAVGGGEGTRCSEKTCLPSMLGILSLFPEG